MARWHSCNVLQVADESRHIWRFVTSKDAFALDHEEAIPAGAALPDNLIGKNWRSLWQRNLNIAWLPPEKVFLRVAHLPVSDFKEAGSNFCGSGKRRGVDRPFSSALSCRSPIAARDR